MVRFRDPVIRVPSKACTIQERPCVSWTHTNPCGTLCRARRPALSTIGSSFDLVTAISRLASHRLEVGRFLNRLDVVEAVIASNL